MMYPMAAQFGLSLSTKQLDRCIQEVLPAFRTG